MIQNKILSSSIYIYETEHSHFNQIKFQYSPIILLRTFIQTAKYISKKLKSCTSDHRSVPRT